MTPKEKAQELVLKFKNKHLEGYCFTSDFNPEREQRHLNEAKGLSLIAVDELINAHNGMKNFLFSEIGYLITSPEYWQEVKYEIEKL